MLNEYSPKNDYTSKAKQEKVVALRKLYSPKKYCEMGTVQKMITPCESKAEKGYRTEKVVQPEKVIRIEYSPKIDYAPKTKKKKVVAPRKSYSPNK
jgi:hypothetical protein